MTCQQLIGCPKHTWKITILFTCGNMFVPSGGNLCKALLFIQWSILSANRDDHKIEFYDKDDDDIIIAIMQLSPEGEVNSGGYILRREAWYQIQNYLPNQMDKKTLLQFLLLKLSQNDEPFFSRFAKQWISKDILSYWSQSKCAKIAIHWFGKY